MQPNTETVFNCPLLCECAQLALLTDQVKSRAENKKHAAFEIRKTYKEQAKIFLFGACVVRSAALSQHSFTTIWTVKC